jgi:hypothetical protein
MGCGLVTTAKRTKAKKAVATITSAAFANGRGAHAATYVQPGFSFSDEDDLAFALGYPHAHWIADGHPDDATPEASARAHVKAGLEEPTPREVAHRIARALRVWAVDLRRDEELAKAGPISADEAQAIIAANLNGHNAWVWLFVLEALVGPDVVARAVVAELDRYSSMEWTDSGRNTRTNLEATILEFGYILLRVAAPLGVELRARLEHVHGDWDANQDASGRFVRRNAVNALDVVLHGADGADRSARRIDGAINAYAPLFVLDDPAWFARIVRASGPPEGECSPDPRRAFLGGEEVLELELSWWKKYSRSLRQMVERFGRIKSAKLLPWMLELSSSKAKTPALAWFTEHAGFARSFLEAAAGGPEGTQASVILSKLG